MPAAYPLPNQGEPIGSKFRLGSLCFNGHDWGDTGKSLRYAKISGACVICARASALIRQERRKQQDPQFKAKAAAYVRAKRQREGRASRAKHSPEWHEQRRLQFALHQLLRPGMRSPSVAQLVYQEQVNYWRLHPEAYKSFDLARKACYHRWRHMTDESYRLYHRQKSKRRKAVMRESVGIQLTGKQIKWRFEQFGHSCAYCGGNGDLHIEHVVPISKGGTHALGNIIPACKPCNYSKSTKGVETWYRAQPFFTNQRWNKIRRVLGWNTSSVGQLALL